MPRDLRIRVLARVDELMDLARKTYKVSFAAPLILFNARGTVGGTASIGHWAIRLNPVLLIENEEEYFVNTIPHEVSHLIAELIQPGTNHGKVFDRVMRSLGANPSHTHDMDVETATEHLPLFRYHCGCTTFEFSARRHNPIVRGHSMLTCNLCKQAATYSGEWRREGTWTTDPIPPVEKLPFKSRRRPKAKAKSKPRH